MKRLSFIIALAAVGTGLAHANDAPVPSFNDVPEIYSHSQPYSGAGTSAAQNRPVTDSAMNYGPWLVTPSSGA